MPARKLVLYIATSLDGYIARDSGAVDWLFSDQDYGYTAFLESVDVVLMGRKTYDQILTFGEFPYQGKKSYVFSRAGGPDRDEHVGFVPSDPVRFTRELLGGDGPNIWLVGGSEIVRKFLGQDLIDEYIISIHPVLLGSGIPLFTGGYPQKSLELLSARQYSSGLVQVSYQKALGP